jgi:hypothetical protein
VVPRGEHHSHVRIGGQGSGRRRPRPASDQTTVPTRIGRVSRSMVRPCSCRLSFPIQGRPQAGASYLGISRRPDLCICGGRSRTVSALRDRHVVAAPGTTTCGSIAGRRRRATARNLGCSTTPTTLSDQRSAGSRPGRRDGHAAVAAQPAETAMGRSAAKASRLA